MYIPSVKTMDQLVNLLAEEDKRMIVSAARVKVLVRNWYWTGPSAESAHERVIRCS